MAKIDTTDRFPWNEIVGVTDTALGDCVRIPKIFVKNSVDENGLITRMISNVKLKGYHCHPAFMQDGHERNAILIKKALDAENNLVTFDAAKTAETAFKTSHGVDYHMYNIYEHHLIALLMLIEYGTTDLQNAMGGSDTATTADWYGLPQHWGDVTLWVDGIDTKGTDGAVRIFDNLGNFTLQDTTVNIYTENIFGYFSKVTNAKGENYDLSDVFIQSDGLKSNFANGSFGDRQDIQSQNKNIIISYALATKELGAFSLTSTEKAAYRMAKFTD